ncbi:hypothetical protein PT974_11202 [Cladobotryum mycophilum]|uniref:BRCT domain-containing protein n=1 Tax=Cladobotryum mycophilum TaxID=491253 RepID=A0ABR0S4J4_9HYPO
MPPPKQPLPKQPAAPRYGAAWDPWNSASTGHQVPESNPGTGWRNSRSKKLNSQFGAGDGSGGDRLSDTWGAGSEDYDEQRKALVPRNIKDRKGRSVMDMLKKPGLMRRTLEQGSDPKKSMAGALLLAKGLTGDEALMEKRRLEDEEKEAQIRSRGIFDGVVIYVNGSTFPLVSDHKLKQILSENGGIVSLNLGRRRVTHVILGRPNGAGPGAGGGLAAGKMEKEIKKIGGAGVRFIGVEWVLESLKAGKRLPEARFSNVKTALKGQGSVYGLYSKQAPTTGPSTSAGGA